MFCFIDDFNNECEKEIKSHVIQAGNSCKPTRLLSLTLSEIITIILLFQQSPCRNFKFFYHSYLRLYKEDFPKMPSYEGFITLMPRIITILTVLLCTLFSSSSEISYIDSTSIAVCHPKRISRNKVFKVIASLGKTTKGWFYGMKLHVIINEKGCLIKVKLTPGNKDDRSVVAQISKNIMGILCGDKGYISKKLFLALYKRGFKLITGLRKGMNNFLMPLYDKILLRKRSIIETVFDYLKNKFQIEHSRHRSPLNAFIHTLSTLTVYQLMPIKPSISNAYFISNP